jgi:hypothetical protein
MNRKWESIKQEYLFADTFEERRIIAICAALIAWTMKGERARFPTRKFLNDFLEASFQYEKHKLQRIKLQHITQKIAKEEELQHAEAEVYWSKEFIKQLEKQTKEQNGKKS